jgi:hypothetical protein
MIAENAGCHTPCRKRETLTRIKQLFALSLVGMWLLETAAAAQTLRVVNYNICQDSTSCRDYDTSNPGVPSSALTTVLQGIGNAQLAGHSQPIDVLALQELYGDPSVTLSSIVSSLNGIYGAGTYVYDTTADPTTGNFLDGNGPSGLIYNHNTVQLLSATAVGSASGSGAPRAPMRYTLAPKGYTDHSADFTIYVSHMKSGDAGTETSGSNGYRRNVEAQTIRDNAFTLNDSLNGATSNEVAHVIYSGDYNWGGATENAYQTMISSSIHSGIMKANDTLNPANNWDTSSTFKGLLTESATFVQYRDDVQLVTTPMLSQPGMQLVPNTLRAFGNGGNIYHQSVTNSANNNTLTELANRSAVMIALTNATDHLPVVADYSFATAVGAPGDFDHSGVVNLADFNLWRSTFGTTGSNLLADANHNNVVDAADYLIWRRYWPGGSGTSTLSVEAQVPEPAACVLILTMALLILGGRMSRKP